MYKTKDKNYPSTFQPIIAFIWALNDPKSVAASISALAQVERMLADRFREELPGERPEGLRLEYAHYRIAGAVTSLEELELRVRRPKACTEFGEMVALVLAEARRALAAAHARLAPTPVTPAEPEPTRAAWATAPIGEEIVKPPDLSDV